jgi:cholesterol transport system auxiliary component
MIRRSARLAGLIAVAVALSGCSFNLFPKETPEQLYRFGGGPAAPASDAAGRVSVLDDTLGFNREAASDRILTVTGDQIAYVKGGRWAAAAPVMFKEAVQHAFEASGGPARLIERGAVTKVDYVLKLDVSRFEARYAGGADAAPTIVVHVRASLARYADHSLVGERLFEAQTPASENRIGAMATAFDQATDQVLGQIVAWVGQASS